MQFRRRGWLCLLVGVAVSCGGDGTGLPETPQVATVEVSSAQPITWVGGTRQLTAIARSADGTVVSGVTFTWSSSEVNVALVGASTGLVIAAANGTTTITATAGSVSGSTTITVAQAVAAITVAPALDTILAAGQSRAFTANVLDSGSVTVVGASVRWSSANPLVATIDSISGLVQAIGPGTVALTASVGSVTRAATLVVRNGVLVGNRVLLTDYGNVNDNHYRIGGYFVVWWYPTFDYSADAQQILDWLETVKTEATQLGLQHPPTDARGTYLNIYIHQPGPGNDNYPDDWGAGVGTDSNGLPFMSVGNSQRGDPQLFRHEGFHLYQYVGARTSPGFAYAGDGSWFTEASATWFAALPFRTNVDTHLGAATVPANPQLALWHGWTSSAAGDPPNWNRTTRQYALSTWLDWLTTTGGAPVSVLVDGYKTPTTMLPQEFLNSRVTGLGAKFADWAAASTPDMSYLTRAQWTRALQELATYGDAADRHENVIELVNAGTDGAYVQPPATALPRGWGWNVIHVSSTQAATWRFEVDGAVTGSAGAPAVFEARLVTRTAAGDVVQTVPLTNGQDGFIDVTTSAVATEFYFLVAAVPLHFRGHQTYSYRIKIDRS